jgi:hemoglobin
MRHNPYKINPAARERWLLHMRAGLESLTLPPLQEAELWAYLDRAATAMLNTFED